MQEEPFHIGDIRLNACAFEKVDFKTPSDSRVKALAVACNTADGAVACVGQRP